MPPKPESPEQVREWLQAAIRNLWPLALGSLSFRKTRCGQPGCLACAAGEQHRSHVLYGRVGGRRFAVYVPADLVAELERGLANGRRLQEVLYEAGKRYALALKRERTRRRTLSSSLGSQPPAG